MQNNFKYLDDLIRSGVKEIVLDSDVIYEDTIYNYEYGMELDVDDLVIDGKGHTIDANYNKARIFRCNAKNITLKNITFKNGTAENGGGAIYNDWGSSLTLVSCSFEGNSSKGNGGAIYNDEGGSLSLVSCSFEGNSSRGNGGAIYNGYAGSLSLDGYSHKIHSSKTSTGGFLSLVSCSFEDNSSRKQGGAIFNRAKLTVTESTFKDNFMENDRNDIFNDYSGRIFSKQSFLKTLQMQNMGIIPELKYLKTGQKDFSYLDELIHNGAKEIKLECDILLNARNNEESRYSEGIDLDVDDMVIDGNGHTIDAQYLTGIFSCNAKNITLKNITFKNGFANTTFKNGIVEKDGGAIYNDSDSSLSLKSCSFESNSSEFYGGAIANRGSLSLKSCSFEANSSKGSYGNGGAICNGGSLSAGSCSFKDNSSQNGSGGAIYNTEEGSLSLVSCSFEHNSSGEYGGAIHNFNGNITVTESNFAKNAAQYGGGAIGNNGGEITLTESTLEGNTAQLDGGAIYDKGKKSLGIENCTFKGNDPDDVYEEKD